MSNEILSWGCELEFGDVDRTLLIPETLGDWNYFETDIVNQRGQNWGIATDPYGVNPKWGGEVNTRPTKTWRQQLDIIKKLIEFFTENGCPPTVSCVSNTHIHAGVEKSNLVKLFDYTIRNQKIFVDTVYDFNYDESMNKEILNYLLFDSGKLVEQQKIDLIKKYGNYFKIIRLDKNFYNRYAINLESLNYNKTVEFRCFRATLNLKELEACFMASEYFLKCALNCGPDLDEAFKSTKRQYPKLNYDEKLFTSWQKTKHPPVSPTRQIHKQYEILV
jgi:hypothetical protein